MLFRSAAGAASASTAADDYTGGIEDDTAPAPEEDRGFADTMDELQKVGRLAGGHSFQGSPDRLLSTIRQYRRYSAIVVGDVYHSKPPEIRKRLADELLGLLTDHLESPVVSNQMLRARVKIGPELVIRLVLMLAATVVLYQLVFTNQEWVLNWLAGERTGGGAWRVLRVASVAVFVPLVAYLYGTSARLILRFLRVE